MYFGEDADNAWFMAVELRRKGSGDCNITEVNTGGKEDILIVLKASRQVFGLYWCLDVLLKI